MAGHVKKIVGNKYGRLLVCEFLEIRRNKQGAGTAFWKCQCDCGNITEVRGWALVNGSVKSCGCLISDTTTKRLTVHGMGNDKNKEYSAWKSMRARCYRESHKRYPLYGGRGIKVCEKWRNDFLAFLSDMGKSPSAKHSLERIDVDGNYEPENCKWATQKEQMNNVRNNIKIQYNGETLTISQLCEKFNISNRIKIAGRLKLGWSVEDAIAI